MPYLPQDGLDGFGGITLPLAVCDAAYPVAATRERALNASCGGMGKYWEARNQGNSSMQPSPAIPSPAVSGAGPGGCSEKVFASGQLASFLGLTGKAVRRRMRNEPAMKLPSKGGQTANGWALPGGCGAELS